jgi:50S ribosomal subunit-associated GTPase HflX
MRTDLGFERQRGTGLVDVLDRVLDKGLLVAGDIRVSLAEVELLTIRIRLVVCSIDKAQEIGLDWWKNDRYFSGGGRRDLEQDNAGLKKQIRDLQRQVAALSGGRQSTARRRALKRKTR